MRGTLSLPIAVDHWGSVCGGDGSGVRVGGDIIDVIMSISLLLLPFPPFTPSGLVLPLWLPCADRLLTLT